MTAPETTYPALAPQIARLRAAGIRDAVIAEGIEHQLRDAQALGYTREQVETVARQGLKHPMPEYVPGGIGTAGSRGAYAAFEKEMGGIGQPPEASGLMSAFGRGILRGLTLGYAGESSPDHPLATIAGELLGGVVPGAALFAASAPVGGIAAGLAGASRFAPIAARFGPMAARLGLGETGAAGIGALAREAATGAAFGGLWKPEGEGGVPERLTQAGVGAVTAPPLALGLRGLTYGLGAARRRFLPGQDTSIPPHAPEPGNMGAGFPAAPAAEPANLGALFPSVAGDQAQELARAFGLPAGISRPSYDFTHVPPAGPATLLPARPVPTSVPAAEIPGFEGVTQWVETPRGVGGLRRYMRDVTGKIWNEVTFGPDDIEWFAKDQIRPVGGPDYVGRAAQGQPSVPRGTPPAATEPFGEPAAPAPKRPRGGGPRIELITSSGQKVMRRVEDLRLEDLTNINGVSVEFHRGADAAGFSARRRPDGQIEVHGRGGTLDIFPDDQSAEQFIQGAATSGGAAVKQPVERTTGGGTTTLDKAMGRGGPLGSEDQANLHRQRIANATGAGTFQAEIADPARREVERQAWNVAGDVPKGQVRSLRGIRNRADLEAAKAAVEGQGYKYTLLEFPGSEVAPPSYEMVYFWARSPSINRAIALHQRSLIRGPEKLSAPETMFLGRVFGLSDADIAAQMTARTAPGPAETAGTQPTTTWTKPPDYSAPRAVPTPEEIARYHEANARMKAEKAASAAATELTADQERELIRSMDIRSAAEEAAAFPFGANKRGGLTPEQTAAQLRALGDLAVGQRPMGPENPYGLVLPMGDEAVQAEAAGPRKGRGAKSRRVTESQQAISDRQAIQLMTTRTPPEAPADFLIDVAPGLSRRVGLRRGMTVGEMRRAAGLDVPTGAEPGMDRTATPPRPSTFANVVETGLRKLEDTERYALGLHRIDKLRDLLGDPKGFNEHILGLFRQGLIDLMPHSEPSKLSPEVLAKTIPWRSDHLYFIRWLGARPTEG